jgi:hypothetical protein
VRFVGQDVILRGRLPTGACPEAGYQPAAGFQPAPQARIAEIHERRLTHLEGGE